MAKFKKGQSGNPKGRPKGVLDRRSRYRTLIEQHIPDVIEKVVSAAVGGDMMACKILLDRVLPRMRPQSEPIALAIEGGCEVSQASAVTGALFEGSISPEQAASIMSVIAESIRIREHTEFEARLEALEKRYGDCR